MIHSRNDSIYESGFSKQTQCVLDGKKKKENEQQQNEWTEPKFKYRH